MIGECTTPSGNGGSPTYGQWAVYSVSTPLVSAFQQDAGKESVLKVQSTGEGELADLIEEFSEGRVQFAYVKVTDSNTGLPKNVLIGWCGEGVPERTKGYFTSHLATVSKFLHGYHVQVTARADGDLTPEGIVQRVADSSGSKYSAGEASAPASAPRPAVASKPAFTPTRSGGITPNPAARVQPTPSKASVNDDGWGADAPPVTRTQLEKVQSAYQPTRVNLQELKANPTASRQPAAATSDDSSDVVRGGYQPVGKVDIAAIRKQAAASGQLKDDRPAIIKGSYEPVGKVDIAAIRARAQKPEGTSENVPSSIAVSPQPTTLPERPAPSNVSERLTNLPKPKVAKNFGPSPSFPGTKPPLPVGLGPKPTTSAQIGAASRTFADEGGKTPAQIWAERKAKERGVAPSSGSTEAASTPAPIQSQISGQSEWKSSYTGKSWAPVQTAQERSYVPEQPIDAKTNDQPADEPRPHVSDVRDQFAHETPAPAPLASPAPPVPQASRPVPVPGLSSAPVESEPEHDAQQVLPPPPPQPPRSPTPPTPVRESSPIQIAMPVGHSVADSVADVHEEQQSPPPAMPVRSLQEVVPDERELEDDSHDLGRAAAAATAPQQPEPTGGPRAQVQYDYEKAEDNEIELREGEYVTDIEMVDQDWWVGVNIRGERGLFPANYVEIVEDKEPASHAPAGSHHYEAEPEPEPEPEPTAAPVPVAPTPSAAPSATVPSSKQVTATALYDYEAAEDNEISFPEDAKISNVEFPDDDWWLGEYNGKQGLFPANYVRLDQ
ncbi:Dynamin [Penicillium coprophilum]|uniref:Dynamin n=1 Tax=Penicillium coprophilum TaxID=36646 RepID=UPI0023831ECD|nr:Dynamin [Penicillium coprophilum]KAJ5159228.1 Dynamin [Penicillium coprophilum]